MQYKEYQSLSMLPENCRSLIKNTSKNNLYLSAIWFTNFVQTGLEENAKVHILAVEDEQAEICYALLFLRSPAGQNGSRFFNWNLRPDTLASLSNFQSSFFTLLFSEHANTLEEICQTLVYGLKSSNTNWHLLDLNLFDPYSREYLYLQKVLKNSGYLCKEYLYKGNWHEQLESSSFEDYIRSRERSSKKSIQNYQRKMRKLDKAGRLRLEIYSGNESLAKVLKIYNEIYKSSWKQEDYFPDFYPGLIQQSAENGSLRMVFVYVDDKPVAFEYAIVTGLQCVMMRTAYVPEFSRESVGAIAILSMIEYVINSDRVKEIDFGTDDDQYKSTWVKQRRERYGLICFSKNTVLGRFYFSRYLISEWIESLVGVLKKLRSVASNKHD